MKPLTTSEQQLIIKLCDLIPEFEELAKDTWPDMFEQKKIEYLWQQKSYLALQRGGRLHRNMENRINEPIPPIFFDQKPSDALKYDDEYDV